MGLLRKVIRIRAEDSPNVRHAQAAIEKYGETEARKRGLLKNIIPGVLSYDEYRIRRATWSTVEQAVTLDAEFAADSAEMLFPLEWLNHSNEIAILASRHAKYMGVDTAEGGDNTVWLAINEYGVLDIKSQKTPNTAIIPAETMAFAAKHGIQAHNIYFDMGGGGKEHHDVLHHIHNYPVNGVRFGSAPTPHRTRAMTPLNQRDEEDDTRYVYKNRRAEMYHLLSLAMNPDTGPGFAIPGKYTELRRQLSPIPRKYDGEGRLFLPPKNAKKSDSDEVTMRSLIGCSPDEADALVLAVYGWKKGKRQSGGGVVF